MKYLGRKKQNRLAKALGLDIVSARCVAHFKYKVITAKGSELFVHPDGIVQIIKDNEHLPRNQSCPWLMEGKDYNPLTPPNYDNRSVNPHRIDRAMYDYFASKIQTITNQP